LTGLPISQTRSPATQEELAACVREAFETGTPLYPIGGGTSLDFGLPARSPGKGLSLAELNRIVDYPARDMTITVEAGVTMQTLAELLARERQRLPVDVPQAEQATIGGVIATNWNGPRRLGQGPLRDYVIGISAVDGRGQPFQGGGRVVKNVAGYDFCKLLTGSLGTLGVITQVTLRLKPVPEQSALVACAVPDSANAEKLLAALINSQTTPTAVELLAGPAWEADPALLAVEHASRQPLFLVVGLEGTVPEVEFMVHQLTQEWRELGVAAALVVGEAHALWQRLIEFPAAGRSPLVLKASVVPSGTTAILDAARRLDPACSVQAHAGNGILIIKLSQFPADGLSRALVGGLQPAAAAHHGQVVVLANPSGAEMTHQSVWGATDSPLDLMSEVNRRARSGGFQPPNDGSKMLPLLRHAGSLFSAGAFRLAEVSEEIKSKNPRVVAVAEGDGVGVIAHRLHAGDGQRLRLHRREHRQCQRVFGLAALLSAGGTGAGIPQFANRVLPPLAVAPIDQQAVVGRQFECGGEKHGQTPTGKAPDFKHQISNKFKAPNQNVQNRSAAQFGTLFALVISAYLVIGA
jgi:glycolate oxidase FAD binding subunit